MHVLSQKDWYNFAICRQMYEIIALLKYHLLQTLCCKVASVVSDSVRPQRRQPTRLPRPWDSPGKNTGVGCHFLLQGMRVKSEREVAQLCPTPSDPMDCSPAGSSVHGIFQARGLEWGATNTLVMKKIRFYLTKSKHIHNLWLNKAIVIIYTWTKKEIIRTQKCIWAQQEPYKVFTVAWLAIS